MQLGIQERGVQEYGVRENMSTLSSIKQEFIQMRVRILERSNNMIRNNIRNLVIGFAVGSLGLALAVGIPNPFTNGTVISSSAVNANFTAVKTAVDALENKTGVLTRTTLNLDSSLGQKITLYGNPEIVNDSYGIGVQGARMYFRIIDQSDHFFSWYFGGKHTDGATGADGDVLPAMYLDRVGNLILRGTLSEGSDRNIKRNIQAVNTREMLKKVVALPIQKWEYKADPKGLRHLGPMAQDFSKAFSLGKDDKTIATVDADGVALAAIQGLNQVVLEKDAKIQSLEKRVSQLESLEARLTKLEAARR
jgi:hypothetical protein